MIVPISVDEVHHGDCIEFMNSMPPKSVDLVFADPPYNLQLGGELWRPNMTRVDAVTEEWDQFESMREYDDFTRRWLTAARRVLKDTGTLWVIGSYHNIYRVGAVMMELGFWILNDVVWVKHNPLPQMKGVRFCNAHETLLWAKRSKQQSKYTFHYKALKAGNEDKQMRSDWYFPICSGGEREMIAGRKAHSTQKPEALLHRVITATSNPGDLVLDPFCGTGTTAAVAKKLGRRYLTIDKEERYVEVAKRRLAAISPALIEVEPVPIDPPKPRVSFASLVEAGVLQPGQKLALKGRTVEAEIMADGTLVADGFRGSIHKVGAKVLGLPACNGWTHWLFQGPDGEWRLIDDLRVGSLFAGVAEEKRDEA